MKRIFVGLLAAFLMTAGLVTVSTSTATAACPSPDYPGCVRTSLYSKGVKNITTRQRATIYIGVRAAGNADPVGRVRMTLVRRARPNRPVIVQTKRLVNRRTQFTLPRLPKGRYLIKLRYIPREGTLFMPSKGKTRTLLVRTPRRRA